MQVFQSLSHISQNDCNNILLEAIPEWLRWVHDVSTRTWDHKHQVQCHLHCDKGNYHFTKWWNRLSWYKTWSWSCDPRGCKVHVGVASHYSVWVDLLSTNAECKCRTLWLASSSHSPGMRLCHTSIFLLFYFSQGKGGEHMNWMCICVSLHTRETQAILGYNCHWNPTEAATETWQLVVIRCCSQSASNLYTAWLCTQCTPHRSAWGAALPTALCQRQSCGCSRQCCSAGWAERVSFRVAPPQAGRRWAAQGQ